MRLRLFLSFGLVALVSVLGVVLIARENTTTAVRAFMYRGGMSGAEELVEMLGSYYEANGSWIGAESLMGGQGRGRGQGQGAGITHPMGEMMNQRLRLANIEGTVVSDSGTTNPRGEFSKDELDNAIAIQVDGKTVGYLLAEGGMGFNQRDEVFLVERLTRAAQTAALIAGGLSLLLSLLLAYHLMHPVRQLTQAARKLGEGDLSQRVEVKGSDELGLLARTFNRMADALQNVEETRRSMTADIAHELRNPLAVQRANLEAMQDGLYPLTPQALEPVLEQNLLLTRLVEDLRTLALADAGELKLERVEIEFFELVERIVERFKPQAAVRSIAVEMMKDDALPLENLVNADPVRIEQILSNLISNALRHAPDGGLVRVETKVVGDQIQLRVHDNGAGIPADAFDHIFERFYRADRSRSRAEGGTGLGLAIARKLAEAHRGTLTASNHPDGGASFTLALPLS